MYIYRESKNWRVLQLGLEANETALYVITAEPEVLEESDCNAQKDSAWMY